MKILLITHIFPPAVDGGSRVISKIGEYLSDSSNKTFCLTTDCKSTDDFVNFRSLPLNYSKKSFNSVFRLPVYKFLRKPFKLINVFIPKKFYLHQLLDIFQKGPVFRIIPFIKAIIFLKKQKIDLIIAGPLPTTIVIYANFLKKFLNTKLLINASFHETDKDFLKIPLINILKSADYIWSLTEHEKKYFIKNFNINSQKIILAGNGVDQKNIIKFSEIKFPKNPQLLFIGSLASHKRVELLISAFSNLVNSIPNLNLTIAGQKTLYYPQIEKLIKTKNCQNRINFVFDFPQDHLTKLIDSATILILPSVQESFGLVLIESWARGKPVIGTNIPALNELITKTNGGLCFKKDNLADLEDKILKLIQDPTLCKNLGKNGLDYIKNNYTWEQVGKKIWQKIS